MADILEKPIVVQAPDDHPDWPGEYFTVDESRWKNAFKPAHYRLVTDPEEKKKAVDFRERQGLDDWDIIEARG